MRNHYIASYTHSDNLGVTGVASVRVTTDTDFAARSDSLQSFANKLAMRAFGASALIKKDGPLKFKAITKLFPEIEEERVVLSKELREEVVVSSIFIVKQW